MWGIVIGIVLVGAVAYGGYVNFVVVPKRLAAIDERLFVPYFDARGQDRLREAYDRYTTEQYKEAFTFEDYRAQHDEIAKEHGPLKSWEIVKYSAPFRDEDGAQYQLTLRLKYERGSEGVLYEVVRHQDQYLILDSQLQFGDTYRPVPM